MTTTPQNEPLAMYQGLDQSHGTVVSNFTFQVEALDYDHCLTIKVFPIEVFQTHISGTV